MRSIFLKLLILAAFAFAPIYAQTPISRPAQPAGARAPMMDRVDPALFRGLRYRLVGPSRGGRVTMVMGVPSQPRTFYMGVASGGLFRTTDGGANWVPITDGKVPLGSSGSIGVADSDPKIIYYGTGSDGVRSNVSTGRGVYKTVDAGETWRFVGLYTAGQIGAVRIHPTNPDIVWVAAVGDAFKKNDERGRVQDDRRRTVVEKSPVRQRRPRRDGPRAAAGQPGRRVRVDVAARAQAVDDHQRIA